MFMSSPTKRTILVRRIMKILIICFGSMLFLLAMLPCPLCVRHADAASVTLAWDPNIEPDLLGYRLYYGKASRAYEFVIDVGNHTTYNILDLEDEETYYFTLKAYNVFGYESDFSNEVSYPGPIVTTISLATGWNLISLPVEPFDPAIGVLTGQISSCLLQVLAYENDSWLYYDPSQLDQNTLNTMESGKGYWVEMACPVEMRVTGNRTTKPINLAVGKNFVGYNSLTPLPISTALAGIANKYTRFGLYKDDQWIFYDPSDEAGSPLKVLSPGNGYWIEVTEETTWTLPYTAY